MQFAGTFYCGKTNSMSKSMGKEMDKELCACDAQVELERDVFLRTLVRELSGTLEEVVGLEEASGFISVVGQHMGEIGRAHV